MNASYRTKQRASGLGGLLLLAFLSFVLLVNAKELSRREIPIAEREQIFLEAGQAYDKGDMPRAIRKYDQLVADGYIAKELFFNKANAYFRNGEIGRAVLNYRSAWQLAPRDPDIQANLRFALDAAGALRPAPSVIDNLLQKLSLPEWTTIATFSYWLSAGLLCIILLLPRWRYIAQRLLLLTGLFLMLGLWGSAHWTVRARQPEAVVIEPDQEALFAPLEGSTAHFDAPEGSIVRIKDSSESWLEIAVDGKSGWLKETACQQVYPWHSF